MHPDSQYPSIEVAPTPKMSVFCPHCQTRLSVSPSQAGNSAECPNCSGKFQIPLPVASPSGSNAFYDRASSPEVRAFASKKVAAGVCGLLLGVFGVHKFILGLNKPATIMLASAIFCLTFGLCLILPMFLLPVLHIVGLIEGILYLTKSDEEFYQTYAVEEREWF